MTIITLIKPNLRNIEPHRKQNTDSAHNRPLSHTAEKKQEKSQNYSRTNNKFVFRIRNTAQNKIK
jgi:hypothetical protein